MSVHLLPELEINFILGGGSDGGRSRYSCMDVTREGKTQNLIVRATAWDPKRAIRLFNTLVT